MSQAINGAIDLGDWVIVTPDNNHGCLIGVVERIVPFGSIGYLSGDGKDDVHVNFIQYERSETEQAKLLEALDHIYPKAKTFDDLPLDDVIIAPDSLIRVTELGFDRMHDLIANYDVAKAFCDIEMSMPTSDDKKEALKERLNSNLSDYHDTLMTLSKRELIEKASKISDTYNAHLCFTDSHGFEDSELTMLLLYQNPLQILANVWQRWDETASEHSLHLNLAFDLDIDLEGDYPFFTPSENLATVMSELKQSLLKYELAKAGFPNAQYVPETDKIVIDPANDRIPQISNSGEVRYWPESRDLAMNTIAPLAKEINELVGAWEKSDDLVFEGIPEFRKLAEYGNIVLAARDDSEYERGFHFVTWEYDYDRTGFHHGHYMTDYTAAKEDFALRSGLIPRTKVLTQEQAIEVRRTIDFSLNNNEKLSYNDESELKKIYARLTAGYALPPVDVAPPTTQAYNGDICVGDLVVSMSPDCYSFLVGKVKEITPFGSPEHDTGNLYDDVHVDFTAAGAYSDEREGEIAEVMSGVYGEAMPFEDCSLDDVIMPPDVLIRVTDWEPHEIQEMLDSRKAAEGYCFSVVFDKQQEALGRENGNGAPPAQDSSKPRPKLDDMLGAADRKVKEHDSHGKEKPQTKRGERS